MVYFVMEYIARTPGQVGNALMRRRQDLNLRQGDMNTRLNLRQATISSVENGAPGTRLSSICDILSVLGLEFVIRPVTETDSEEDIKATL